MNPSESGSSGISPGNLLHPTPSPSPQKADERHSPRLNSKDASDLSIETSDLDPSSDVSELEPEDPEVEDDDLDLDTDIDVEAHLEQAKTAVKESIFNNNLPASSFRSLPLNLAGH